MLELLVVLTMLTIMASLAAPSVTDAIVRAKEASLKENLSILRRALDDYYADKGQYPEYPEQLVDEKYIRFMPKDPIYEGDEWNWVPSDDISYFGIVDVFSYSENNSISGERYSEW